MRYFAILIIIICLISCNEKQPYNIVDIPAVPIQGELLEEEIISTTSGEPCVLDSFIFICDTENPRNIFTICDERTGKTLSTFGTKGNGPGEFNYAIYAGQSQNNDTVYIASLPNKVVTLVKDEQWKKYKFHKEQKIFLE